MHSDMAILWPTFGLALLIFTVWLTLLRRRFQHIGEHPPRSADFADGAAVARYFRPVERPAHNLTNLLEMPVLYFALVPLLMLTGHASPTQVALGWAYVGLRAWHSHVHIGAHPIRLRARVYIASCAVLAAMWLGFAFDLLLSGVSA